MTTKNLTKTTAEPGKQEIIIEREFDAPRELVFKAFTDADLYVQWFVPRGLTTRFEKFEPRSGGSYRYILKYEKGNEFAVHGVYHEVTPPERIIRTFGGEGPEYGHVLLETSRFEELPNNRTKITSQDVFQSVADRDMTVQSGMEAGVKDSYDRLDELLERMQATTTGAAKAVEKNDLVIARVFDAPRNLVWKAWTECDLIKRWWGPKGFTAPFCKNDLREGGKYLYSMQAPPGKEVWSGKDIWSTGTYKEIVLLKRIVTTDSFADEKGNIVPATHYGMNADFPLEMLLTVTFEDYDGKTKLTLNHVGFPSKADSDGARQGWNESLDKLAEALKTLETAVEQPTNV